MKTNTDVIDTMKKITLSLEAGSSPDTMDLSSRPFSFQFIYGVGAHGVCLFEKAHFEKRSGDMVLFQVEPHQIDDLFGHLKNSLIHFLPRTTPFYLRSTVMSIKTADNREVVKAIAQGGGSDNCGCGCGC